jgi:hypothetical protein
LRWGRSRDIVRGCVIFGNPRAAFRSRLILFILGPLALARPALPQELQLDSTGARIAFYGNGAGRNFHQAEAFATWDLLLNWSLGQNWELQSRAEVSAGWIGESDLSAGIFTFGPSLVFVKEAFPVSFEGGVNPTLLTRTDFRNKDFGIPFQFTSHAGFNVDISSKFRLGYRFQHMSNAGLSGHNPGLNLHVFGVSYRF